MDNFANSVSIWYRKAVIVCGAMLASCVMLAVFVEIVKTQASGFTTQFAISADVVRILNYVFYALACSELFAIQLFRSHWRPKEEDDATVKAQHLFRLSIITAALANSVAIYGLMLFVLAALYREFYIFLSISLLLQIYYFPRQSQWQ